MMWTEQEIRSGTVKDAQKRLREFTKTWDLDAPLTKNPEISRQADVLADQLIQLEDWLEALEGDLAVEIQGVRYLSITEASKRLGVEEPTLYYRLNTQPEYKKVNTQ